MAAGETAAAVWEAGATAGAAGEGMAVVVPSEVADRTHQVERAATAAEGHAVVGTAGRKAAAAAAAVAVAAAAEVVMAVMAVAVPVGGLRRSPRLRMPTDRRQ